MLVEIITPDAKLFKGEVLSIELPGTNGRFEILNDHAPIISTLTAGEISIAIETGQKESFEINGGVIEMQNNKIIVLAD
jgi:F-type H+-transporting ATPase subunit epsilon